MRNNSIVGISLLATAGLTLIGLGLIGCTSSPATTSTTIPPSAYTIKLATASGSIGEHLVDSNGYSLYWTTADAPGVSNVPADLLSVWPPFYASDIVVPSPLLASDFGTIMGGDGNDQTTYKNWPLYTYYDDTAPGQTKGQGIGGKWSVVTPGATGPQPVPTTTPPTTTPPTTTTTPPPTTTTPPPTTTTAAVTFGSLAASGQTLYNSTCAVCHGSNGGGSQVCPVVIWGSGSTLGTYNGSTLFTDAAGMLSYISSKMPLTAPGSLSHQQYTEALAYILLKGGLVSSSTVFNESQLGSISIP